MDTVKILQAHRSYKNTSVEKTKIHPIHPKWNAMRVKDEYANSVSNIRKFFLKPA